jgi:hypothetical protein
MNRGVIYIVVGELKYLKECIFSAKSLKKYCPDLPITLFTDKLDVHEDCFNEIKTIKNDINPFKNKVKYLYSSPYEWTLFLDSDTQILKPIYEIFDFIKNNDLALAYVPRIDRSYTPAKLISYVETNPYNTYNTGVILYKKSEGNEKLFGKWLEEVMLQDGATMTSGNRSDQYYFNKLIKDNFHRECNINLAVFPNKIYNVRPPMIQPLKQDGEMDNVKILHCHDLHRSFLMRQSIRAWKKISQKFSISNT